MAFLASWQRLKMTWVTPIELARTISICARFRRSARQPKLSSPFCGCRWRRRSRCRCRARRSASQTHWTLPGCQYNSRQSTFRKSHVWAWKLSFLNIAIPYGWLWNNIKAQFVNFGCQALSCTPECPRWRGKHPCKIVVYYSFSFIVYYSPVKDKQLTTLFIIFSHFLQTPSLKNGNSEYVRYKRQVNCHSFWIISRCTAVRISDCWPDKHFVSDLCARPADHRRHALII